MTVVRRVLILCAPSASKGLISRTRCLTPMLPIHNGTLRVEKGEKNKRIVLVELE